MASKIAKASKSKAKDLRQGITEQREQHQKAKKKVAKPWKCAVLYWRDHIFVREFAKEQDAINFAERHRRTLDKNAWVFKEDEPQRSD